MNTPIIVKDPQTFRMQFHCEICGFTGGNYAMIAQELCHKGREVEEEVKKEIKK